jgi:hypothetical protein
MMAKKHPQIAETMSAGSMKRIGLGELGRSGGEASDRILTSDAAASCCSRNCL